jgi:hypothetical protein
MNRFNNTTSKVVFGGVSMNTMNDVVDYADNAMSKEQFAASFIKTLKHGTRIAEGKEKTAGNAHELMKRLRAEIEEDKRERESYKISVM